MQLSKLTFSLASLIVIFALAFAVTPVMAETDGPTVEIAEYVGPADPAAAADPSSNAPYVATRADFRVKLTFSDPVNAPLPANIEYRTSNAKGTSISSPAPTTATIVPLLGSETTVYVVTLPDMSTDVTLSTVTVIVEDSAIFGSTNANSKSNVGNSETFPLPVLNADTAVSFGTPEEDSSASTQATYNVDLILTNTSTDATAVLTAPSQVTGFQALTSDYIVVEPSGGATVTPGTVVDVAGTAPAAGTSTYPLTVQLHGQARVTLTVDPSYATVPDGLSVTIPATLPKLPDPTNVTAVPAKNAVGNRNNGDILVSWDWEGTAGDLEKYTVEWSPRGDSADVTSGMSYTIPAEELRDSSYDITVTAVATAASGLMNGMAMVEDIDVPTAEPPAAPTVTATANDDDNTIRVEWTSVPGLIHTVKSSVRTTSTHLVSTSTSEYETYPLGTPSGTDPLPQGVPITFTVTATDSDGLVSDASAEATATLKIDVLPTVDISTHAHGANSITVRLTYAEADMVSDSATDPTSGMALDEDDYDARPIPNLTMVRGMVPDLLVTTTRVLATTTNPAYAQIPPLMTSDVSGNNDPTVFDVMIDYTGESLPLYLTLDNAADHVSAISISGGDLMFVLDDVDTPALMLESDKTQTIDIRSATSFTERLPLGNYTIQPYNFFVLVRDKDASGIYDPDRAVPVTENWVISENVALPDLDWFFGTRIVRGSQTNGGTISLHGPAGETAKDLVFSEVMWGSDSSLAVDECSQWIEFYNATPAAINLSGYSIQFHRSQVPSSNWAGAIDLVSNVNANSPYFAPGAFPGQSGRSNAIDHQGALGVQTDIVSMYRHLDEPRIRQFNVANRGERNKGIGGWNASRYPTANISPIHIATPGQHQIVHVTLTRTAPAQRIIINEIGNSSNDAHDWIELYNTTDAGVKIENWELTRVYQDGSNGKEVRVARFPNVTIPAKSYLVVAPSHPNNDGNDLAAGIDITKGDADQRNRGLGTKPTNTTAYYLVDTEVKFANDTGKYLYILRNHHDRLGSAGNVEDVVGMLSIDVRGDLPSGFTGYAAHARQLWNTGTWPLQSWGNQHGDVNNDDRGHGHEDFRPGFVYERTGKNSGIGEHHIDVRAYTGIGYDRHASTGLENGGTPGYSNGSLKAKIADVGGDVSISEIMVVTHENVDDTTRIPRATRLPQWLELYNKSLTQGVNLHNWYLEILNAPSEELGTRDLHGTLRLPSVTIPPNQTVLIVSSSGLDSGNFPDQRVINLFTNSAARAEFNLTNRNDPVLSEVGFYIELRDPDNKVVDKIGNLNVVERRGGLEPRDPSTFDTAWKFMDDETGESLFYSPEGYRTSLIRIYDNGTARNGQKGIGGPKNLETSWVRAADTNFRNVPSLTYYGNHRDYGTPGYRGGGPLPVQLSKFRPERLDDGTVVIRWITESELNNAGFNILRSDTRSGEFTKINTQLIKGNGTTSERNAYDYTDTSAKPNVAYYYQIQDVSIDGDIQTLRVSRLKGNVSAAGKLTTTWGELKLQD